jgi:hypothetical protein
MSKPKRHQRLLRWYPPSWRSRYGEGFAALLDDTYAQDISRRVRTSIARAGLIERARVTGLVGEAANSNDRLLSGSHLVLCGWALFIVAGAMFAKFTEQWGVAIHRTHRTLPSIGDSAVHWAGAVGMALVLAAGLFVFPALTRLLRVGGWSRIRRSLMKSVSVLAVALILTAAMALWAHLLNNGQRNGGSVVYEVAFLLYSLALVTVIGTVTSTVISITRQLVLSRRSLVILSTTALAVTLLMTIVIAGTLTWWASEAVYAPQFLRHSIGSGLFLTSSSFPPTLLLLVLLMILGLVTALSGVKRVVRGYRADTENALS